MSWTRAFLTALAVCALFGALLVGATGCGSDGAGEDDNVRPSPVGKVLKDTDEEGRHYREIDEKSAPEVEIEIQPAVDGDADDGGEAGGSDDGWDVRLTVRDFRFSPAGTAKKAEPGRGYALLRLDGRPLSVLRGPDHHLAADVVSRGTHQVTVRLHADDDTVWAVDGEPVASTADITVSDPGPTPTGPRTTGTPSATESATESASGAGSESASAFGSGSGSATGSATDGLALSAAPVAPAAPVALAVGLRGSAPRVGGALPMVLPAGEVALAAVPSG